MNSPYFWMCVRAYRMSMYVTIMYAVDPTAAFLFLGGMLYG